MCEREGGHSGCSSKLHLRLREESRGLFVIVPDCVYIVVNRLLLLQDRLLAELRRIREAESSERCPPTGRTGPRPAYLLCKSHKGKSSDFNVKPPQTNTGESSPYKLENLQTTSRRPARDLHTGSLQGRGCKQKSRSY